nr:hypothetical protein CFP56_04247 [Quercus suber]
MTACLPQRSRYRAVRPQAGEAGSAPAATGTTTAFLEGIAGVSWAIRIRKARLVSRSWWGPREQTKDGGRSSTVAIDLQARTPVSNMALALGGPKDLSRMRAKHGRHHTYPDLAIGGRTDLQPDLLQECLAC